MKTSTESWLSPLILRYLDLKKALGRGFAVEHLGWAAMAEHLRQDGRLLDHGSIRRQVAEQDRQTACGAVRRPQGPYRGG